MWSLTIEQSLFAIYIYFLTQVPILVIFIIFQGMNYIVRSLCIPVGPSISHWYHLSQHCLHRIQCPDVYDIYHQLVFLFWKWKYIFTSQDLLGIGEYRPGVSQCQRWQLLKESQLGYSGSLKYSSNYMMITYKAI